MKNRLKKRVLAFGLCLAMVITLLPTLAFSEEAAPDTIEQAMTEGEISSSSMMFRIRMHGSSTMYMLFTIRRTQMEHVS